MTAGPLHAALFVLLAAAVAAASTTVAVRRGNAIAADPAVASVANLMTGMIVPASDAIFAAAWHETTAAGSVEHGPSTGEEWQAIERNAGLLLEAAELLRVPGRDATHDRLVALDRERWTAYALALRDGAIWTRDAARARSIPRLLAAGGDISFACERCHLDFRLPQSRRPDHSPR